MKRYAAAVLALAALAGLGCPRGREIEELHLITALAADAAPGGVRVTAVTGVRAGEDEEPLTLTGEGAGMAGACQAVQEARATHAYLGQTEKLLVGESLAREGLMEVLTFVLDHRELRLDTLLYIVQGDAGAGLAASAPAAVGETPDKDRRGVTVGRALSRLMEGRPVRVPALAPDGEGRLTRAGWAVAGRSGLLGWSGGEGDGDG